MRRHATLTAIAAGLLAGAQACDSCFGPINKVEHVRHVKRMQPDAFNATYGPTRGALEWGQLNFLHTTDTHGWLEGHLKETNYGADWGDFVSFTTHMRARAKELGVDLLIVDTGDLHDGAGLSDATEVDGEVSNVIFQRLDYDVLTIGNHELYYADVAYQGYNNFSKVWGDRYLTSNVQILNTTTNEYVSLGQPYRYFTTDHGLRILALGVLFDFAGATNVTRVVPAAQMVNETWFRDLLAAPPGPVDLFLLLGHNTVLRQPTAGTFGYVHDAIRAAYPSTPVQIFGGHSHIRDFQVYDDATTALASGRYCETLGWLAMSGFSPSSSNTTANATAGSNYTGAVALPAGVRTPTRRATNTSTSSPWTYARRYLDWNRLTFEYHALGSQTGAVPPAVIPSTFDTPAGVDTTADIYAFRQQLNLTARLGCSPRLYCMSCVPFRSAGSIYTLLADAVNAVVVNPSRADRARLALLNTGSVRFDLHKGPFLRDDAYIVSPFTNTFLYIPDVPYAVASAALEYLNLYSTVWKRSTSSSSSTSSAPPFPRGPEACVDPFLSPLATRDIATYAHAHAGHSRRQVTTTPITDVALVDGYVTTDAFGTDGDDTAHVPLPSYEYPRFFEARAGFPGDNTTALPEAVDLVFISYIASAVLEYLAAAGTNYSEADVSYYVDESLTTQTYLPLYAQTSPLFQQNLDNCTIY